MRARSISILAFLVTVTLIGSIAATTMLLQQQASAFIIEGGKDFKKLTHEFEKSVINALGGPDTTPADLRLMLADYVNDVNQLAVDNPDLDCKYCALLQSYEEDVRSIFDQSPPMPDKQIQLDHIKDFRALTHDYEKAVIDAFTGPE